MLLEGQQGVVCINMISARSDYTYKYQIADLLLKCRVRNQRELSTMFETHRLYSVDSEILLVCTVVGNTSFNIMQAAWRSLEILYPSIS